MQMTEGNKEDSYFSWWRSDWGGWPFVAFTDLLIGV